MIILDATTKSLQFKLAGSVTTSQLPFFASYIDATSTTTTPGEQDGTSNNTTAVTAVASPASSTQRLIKNITIQNADTVAVTVTIIYNNNSTLRNVIVASLAVGDQLIYEDGNGWICLNSNGYVKTTNSSSSGIPGGVSGQVQYNNGGTFGGLANGQLPATVTNDNAASGYVGEFMTSVVNPTSGISLASNVGAAITSITLTAGDWDIWGRGGVYGNGTGTVVTYAAGDINSTSGSAGSSNTNIVPVHYSSVTLYDVISWAIDTRRVSLASTTTYYLNVAGIFSSSTLLGFGSISARRVR